MVPSHRPSVDICVRTFITTAVAIVVSPQASPLLGATSQEVVLRDLLAMPRPRATRRLLLAGLAILGVEGLLPPGTPPLGNPEDFPKKLVALHLGLRLSGWERGKREGETEFNVDSAVTFMASIWLHPRPIRACAGPQAGVSPSRRIPLELN